MVSQTEEKRGRADILYTAQIFSTKDYDMFSPYVGQPKQRAELNANNISKTMIRDGKNMEPIVINDNFEILDGNTRFYVAKKYNLNLVFRMRRDDIVSDEEYAKEINISQKKMSQLELLEMFSNLNKKEYVRLYSFMKTIDRRVTLAMLTKIEPKLTSKKIKNGDIQPVNYISLGRKVRTVMSIHEAFGNKQASLSALFGEVGAVMNITREGKTIMSPKRLISKIKKYVDAIYKTMGVNKITDRPNMRRFFETAYNYNEKKTHVDIYRQYDVE